MGEITLKNVNGQRYICDGIKEDIKITIEDVPGNDLGAFMDGPRITVYGNVQDGCGNTMSNGEIIIHGRAGDIAGYAMQGGKIFIRDDAGYRLGIHMKEYKDKKPLIIVGGTVGDFLGEYMAGGVILILNLEERFYEANFIGTGMHAGIMYLRGKIKEYQLAKEVRIARLTNSDKSLSRKYIREFAGQFDLNPLHLPEQEFTKLVPFSSRPYGRIYAY